MERLANVIDFAAVACCSSARSILARYVAVQFDRSMIDLTSFCRFLLFFLQDVHLIMLRVCGALFNNVVSSISGFDNRWEDAEHGDG
jgi:hypothetical protein